MVEPTKAPPKKITPSKVEAKDPKSTRPTKGAEVAGGVEHRRDRRQGDGVRIIVWRRGGGGHLEVFKLLLSEYLTTMVALTNATGQPTRRVGAHALRFVIQRDGRIVDITLEKSGGNESWTCLREGR